MHMVDPEMFVLSIRLAVSGESLIMCRSLRDSVGRPNQTVNSFYKASGEAKVRDSGAVCQFTLC